MSGVNRREGEMIRPTQIDADLLNPLENRRNIPRVLVYESTKALWENTGYVVSKTTTRDVGNPFDATSANDV